MFENLAARLTRTIESLRGRGRITEDNIADALREVRVALLEADVALPVIKSFIDAVKAKADGDAYATVKNATANAEALRVQASAITSSPQILELKRIEVEMTKAQNWKGELPSAVYAGAPIPFFNVAGGH